MTIVFVLLTAVALISMGGYLLLRKVDRELDRLFRHRSED